MIEDRDLEAFCAAVQAKRADYFAAHYPHAPAEPSIAFERGKLNARIVSGPEGNRGVFCFVRLADGAVLKADGWKRPAKGVRGNIANGAADVGIYGAAYAR